MKTSPRPASASVSWSLETSSIKTPFPGRVSVPSSFVSLFIFNILSYLPLKTMACFSGRLMSAASNQKLFCEFCSSFHCSFDEFVGEKVVSPSYSSTILTPPSKTWFSNKRKIKIDNIYPDTRNEDKLLLESIKLVMKKEKLQPTPQK